MVELKSLGSYYLSLVNLQGSIQGGAEGLMVKDLSSTYSSGEPSALGHFIVLVSPPLCDVMLLSAKTFTHHTSDYILDLDLDLGLALILASTLTLTHGCRSTVTHCRSEFLLHRLFVLRCWCLALHI
jgi:hypothetical protein